MKARKRTGRKFHDNFSFGCRSCQNGTWLCIFLTHLCNAGCRFCPSPWKRRDKIASAFGEDPLMILNRIRSADIRGISFSGGDCFLVFDRLAEWLTCFKEQRPDIYYWAYTSGLAADEAKLKTLARLGLQEIRYNIAATGYSDPAILRQIRTAAGLFPRVGVEIPSIPEDYPRLADVLPHLDEIGVAYLNLHQFIWVKDPPENSPQFLLNKNIRVHYDADSLKNTRKIKRFCAANSLKMKVNSCTMQKKENQMRLRRRTMGRLFRREYEHLTADGLLHTAFSPGAGLSKTDIFRLLEAESKFETLERQFMHPVEARRADDRTGNRWLDLYFLPPMSYDGKRVLVEIKERNNG